MNRSPFISSLSLSPFLYLFKYNNSHTFSLSLQFQVNARFDRINWTWFDGIYILAFVHALSLSLSPSSAFTILSISVSLIHARIRITRNELAQPDEIHTYAVALYSIYWFIQGIHIHRSNSRCCRTAGRNFECTVSKAVRVSIFHRYRVVLRFVNPRFANQNDFRKVEGRRFGLTSVQRSVGPHASNVRSMKCDDKGEARRDCDKRHAKIGEFKARRTRSISPWHLRMNNVFLESVSMSRMDNCEWNWC